MMKNKFLRLSLFCLDGMMILSSCKKEFTITVQSNNDEWGTVSGGGTYAKGAEVRIKAIPEEGCYFKSWNDGNIDNPRTITVKSDETYVAIFAGEGGGEGKEPRLAVFSVSQTQKVYFSPGNLQWCATAAGKWRFAPNQWNMVGYANSGISETYTDWIDLFGWGTSGYDDKYPCMISAFNTDYGDGDNNISGTNYDWGVYNAIYHPKINATDAPGTWRTLTKGEWVYLLKTRSTTSGIRYAKGKVHNVDGLLIIPDYWSDTEYTLNNTNTADAAYTSNVISNSDWSKMEAEGCILLPAAGYRLENSVYGVGSNGYYWSATYSISDHACYLNFSSGNLNPSGNYHRYYGRSVRLVRDVK